jgi:uncharacterized protein (TIGR02246 family)
MSTPRRSRTAFVLFGCVAAAALCFAMAGSHSGTAGQPPAAALPAAAPVQPETPALAPEDRQPDRDAVRKALDSFTAAFQKGDGNAVAALFANEGEYISDDGTTIRGRAALEKDYNEFLKKNPGNKLEVEVDSIRFPSRDTAVIEGHFKLRRAKGGELIVSRCSFLYAREDGKWMIAIAREWPGDGLELLDLEWLIGSWEAKRDGMVVTTKYEWTANKSFIRCQFTIVQDGKNHTGMQMFGKDPATGALRVWTFEDAGGIGESEITRDGKKWIFLASGATADGSVITATNIMTPVDADSFLWHSVKRTVNDESQPDVPPIKVTRVKAK